MMKSIAVHLTLMLIVLIMVGCHKKQTKIDVYNYKYSKEIALLNQEIVLNEKLTQNKPLLIYAYSRDNCGKCIIGDISMLKELKLKKENVLILANVERTRLENIRVKNESSIYPYMIVGDQEIIMPKYKGQSSRFFILIDSSGRSKLPFYSECQTDLELRTYLKFINKTYFGESDL